ncbi:class I adenylate-forming enzyme family protein [Cellulosilyticum ruminicola]|uniref:class I adenylate-forming enzyme family protein n=1 Tax=Cellulosilyticum ruminicola TaxID=425254 RepID=UPI0006D192AC|nr:class I adenylate-forming enzyme family protein [Cellulosilyticum ruminicola]
MLCMGDFFDEVCEKFKDRECIYFPSTGRHYTYGEFHEYVTDIAKGLIAMGLTRQDHIAIKAVNSPEWIAIEMAATKIGVVLVILNANLTLQELAYAVDFAEVKYLFTDKREEDFHCIVFDEDLEDFIAKGRREVDDAQVKKWQDNIKKEDTAFIEFSSGTTSNPKAIISPQSLITWNSIRFAENLPYNQDDNLLLCLPLAHALGNSLTVLSVFYYGAKMTIIEGFEVTKVLTMIEKERCTIFHAVPTMFMYLLKRHKSFDTKSLRAALIGGSIVSRNLMEAIRDELGIPEIVQMYGQTEVLDITLSTLDDPMDKRMGTAGKALPGVEIKVVDPETNLEVPRGQKGELMFKTPYYFNGYMRNEKATKETICEDGWIHSGDYAIQDEAGYVTICSRLKELIIRAGENIAPNEIENVLLQFPSIREVAVIGVPDEFKGEEIAAFVVTKEMMSKVELKKYLMTVLAKHKVPRYIYFVDSLPKTGSGKISKFALKELYLNKYAHKKIEHFHKIAE